MSKEERICIKWLSYVNVYIIAGKVVAVKFEKNAVEEKIESKMAKKLKKSLKRYFNGKPVEFNFPIALNTTNFVNNVLKETQKIPYGKTITYKDLAERLNTKAYRAVGLALKKNPTPVLIPCHRVVSKKGIGGYSSGIEIKRELLKLEGSIQ